MKNCLIPGILLAGLIYLCSCNSENEIDRLENKIRKKVWKIAEDYAVSNLSDAKKSVLENNLTVIGNDQKKYLLDPSRLFIGCVDEDAINDAIFTLYPFLNDYEVTSEHLFIINTDGKLLLIRALESDMRIIRIENSVITAEIPEHTRNSPLFNCPSCWEVVEYRFSKGELVRIE